MRKFVNRRRRYHYKRYRFYEFVASLMGYDSLPKVESEGALEDDAEDR